MLRLILVCCLVIPSLSGYSQLKKFYTLRQTEPFEIVNFSLVATAGNCVIHASDEAEGLLSIYGNPDLDRINPSFQYKVKNEVCEVSLKLQEFRSSDFSDGIVFAMLKGDAKLADQWKVLFDNQKTYRFDLDYGFGNADVDLSGTAVKSFKVKSGGADIVVDYRTLEPNKIQMDTFLVKVDMGSFVAKHLELTHAKNINANIGFGRASLDFHEPMTQRTQINASVGAGSLDIYVPREAVPMIIYLKDSPFCGIRMLDGFEEVERNVFVNMAYTADAENLMTFNIDVAMGHVAFLYTD